MRAEIRQGNVFDLLPQIPEGSVDACVTSPPYWMLRSYLPKGHALKEFELGSEPTPAAYVANMVRVFGLVRRALADHGTVWLNVGDTYCNAGSRNNGTGLNGKRRGGMADTDGTWAEAKESYPDIRHSIGLDVGSLCLIPQRLAVALSDDGWIVRSVVVWSKPAPMPQSVSGWAWRRCRVKVKEGTMRRAKTDAHRPRLPVNGQGYDWGAAVTGENAAQWADCPGCKKCEPAGGLVLRRGSWRPTSSWEPVLMLAKRQGYFCDGEAVRVPLAREWDASNGGSFSTGWADEAQQSNRSERPYPVCNPAGANPRDVWSIAAEPLKESHYAAYPSELVERCLRAATSSRGYCPHCGAPWCRVVEPQGYSKADRPTIRKGGDENPYIQGNDMSCVGGGHWPVTTLGWRPTCTCPAHEPRPGLVLDPFSGSARTGVAARRLGLDYLGLELNEGYVELSRRILRDQMPLFEEVPE